MFEIRKISTENNPYYTHHIYFNGKILSEKVYEEDEHFYVFEDMLLDEEDFSRLECSSLPDKISIRHTKEKVYNNFNFSGIEKKGDFIHLTFYLDISGFDEENPEDKLGFLYWLILFIKKTSVFTYSIFDINLAVEYRQEISGTAGEAYSKALNQLKLIGETAAKKSKLTEYDFLNNN
jgi:hypothetical protein